MINQLLTITASSSTSSSADAFAAGLLTILFILFISIIIIAVVTVIGLWKTFEKAGRPGWASLIPLYNMYVLSEICGRSGLFFLVCFIPLVGPLIWSIIIAVDLAKAFGKDTAFAIGLFLLTPIFHCIIGFSKDITYQLGAPNNATDGAAGAPAAAAQPAAKPEDPWLSGNQSAQ